MLFVSNLPFLLVFGTSGHRVRIERFHESWVRWWLAASELLEVPWSFLAVVLRMISVADVEDSVELFQGVVLGCTNGCQYTIRNTGLSLG